MKKYIRSSIRIGNVIFYRGMDICKNYGGWVVVGSHDWNIYKTLEDAKDAIRKLLDGTNKREPRVVRQMTEDEFINALQF